MSLVRAAARARPATLRCVRLPLVHAGTRAHVYTSFRPAFRSLATTTPAAADAAAPAASADPKLSKMVDDIAGLTLLQASYLVTLLKVRALLYIGIAMQ